MKRVALLTLFLAMFGISGFSQNNQIVYMADSMNGATVMPVTVDGLTMLTINTENTIEGHYDDGPYDRTLIVTASCEDGKKMGLLFDIFDIDPSDTLFIYDGPSVNYPIRRIANNALGSLYNVTVFPSPTNTTGKLTLRFKTNGDGNDGKGFSISVMCRQPCEDITPIIDSVYDKVRNGQVVGHGTVKWTMQVMKMYNHDSTEVYFDTQYFNGVHLCLGESVVFHGHGFYTNEYGYRPNDSYSVFDWRFGNGDTLVNINAIATDAEHGLTKNGQPIDGVFYRDVDCYDVTLRITDIMGCKSLTQATVRVRLAQNPIKTIYDLAPMCTDDSTIVISGYDAGAAIRMQKINFQKSKSKTIDCKTFIPDGRDANCPVADDEKGFRAPIFFDDFPTGRTVTSAADICSICINYEHSFMGDYRLSLFCPSGERVILKYGTKCASEAGGSSCDPLAYSAINNKGVSDSAAGGGGRYTGIPYGAMSDDSYDGRETNCPDPDEPKELNGVRWYCDSVCNMYGVGMDYCFSRNRDYTLVNGRLADSDTPDGSDFIASGMFQDEIPDYSFIQIPAPYLKAGETAPTATVRFQRPSNHEEKTNYYKPADDFSTLVGCPLNGEWAVQIIDFWGADNGWIFNWSIDVCGINQGLGCEYQVPLDSVIWEMDSSYGDFETGRYRGLELINRDPTRSIIKSTDTAGTFRLNIRIFDSFGCEWDTNTNITSVWSPKPELGRDRLICDVESLVLDAKDRHTATTNQKFTWNPFGQETDTVHTRPMMGSSTLYEVEVQNFEHDKVCITRDSVRVNINYQPMPNFDPGIYPMEGCEPFTLNFDNLSQHADEYLWVFGDGDSSRQESPTHTYGVGQYDLKLFASNFTGCNDSLVYNKLITVYSSPEARFSWEPMNPTVLHPSVTFQNMTIPQSERNKYFWEIQYDRENKISYHTMTDVNPTFEWETNGEDISGTYIARLIAMTENMGPSGNIVECRDTIENKILLVNDFLQFPSAITPNGDGINDKFVIVNLIDGLGYPNNSLAIYDRWGKRVYYKENISSESDFWDPSNEPAGTYFWRFVGKGYLGDIQRNGAVEVIK